MKAFETTFKEEVERLSVNDLPPQEGLAYSSAVADEPFKVVLIGVEERPERLLVRSGVFYSGIIAGCNCADDPASSDLQQEYCELEFDIENVTANTTVRLVAVKSDL